MRIGKAQLIAAFFAVSIFSTGLFAQAEPQIRTRVSANQITLSDSITLTLEISGLQDVRPPWPLNLPGFNVQNAGQTRSVQFVNGQTSSMLAFNYQLTPVQTGELVIPAINLNHGGKTFSTQPIKILVAAGAGAPAGGSPPEPAQSAGSADPNIPTEGLKPVFMTAKVDKSKAYVGEQILLTVQFLRRPHIRVAAQPQYSEPEMTGFIVENLEPKEYFSTIQGERYRVTELRYALFPTSDGDFAIGNAQIQLAVREEPDPFNPNSFFENFFGRNRTIRLNTRAIPIRVRSLPAGKPSQFSGAVGRFKMSANLDSNEFEVGKPFNLVLTINGVGNVQSVKEPHFEEPNSFRKYETITETHLDREANLLNGTKTFKLLLMPQVSGLLTLPSINFKYFDPGKNSYETESVGPFSLDVKTGNLAAGGREPSFSQPGTDDGSVEGVRVVEKDIRFIKTGPAPQTKAPIHRKAGFLVALFLPPFFAAVAALAAYRSKRKTLFAKDYRSKEAYSKAFRLLKQTEKASSKLETSAFYAGLSNSVLVYLSDKFHVSPQGITWEWLERKLAVSGVSEEDRQKVRVVLDEADQARFAPSLMDADQRPGSVARARETLESLRSTLG